MKSAVIVFPGSNCDRDMAVALASVCRTSPAMVWHQETALPDELDLIALPGGFSYGDYLRSGAMATRSPIMRAVADAAARGVHVLGVCNGFQVLTEAGLLPGVLMRNAGITFICKSVPLTVARSDTAFTGSFGAQEAVDMPVAHHDGNYYADANTLDRLDGEGQVVFRYRDNPNGSQRNIAGIINKAGNVLGMMPHPERLIDPAQVASAGARPHGRLVFESLLAHLS